MSDATYFLDQNASPKKSKKGHKEVHNVEESIKLSKNKHEIEKYLKYNDRLLSYGVLGQNMERTSSSINVMARTGSMQNKDMEGEKNLAAIISLD